MVHVMSSPHKPLYTFTRSAIVKTQIHTLVTITFIILGLLVQGVTRTVATSPSACACAIFCSGCPHAGDFFDEIQDLKLDVHTIMEDNIAEQLREIDGKLVELRESAAAIVEEAGEQADNVYNDVCARLDGLLEHTKARLRSGRENIDCDTEVLSTFSSPDSR